MWPLQCSNHADMHASGESHGATGDGCCCHLCGDFQATAGLLGIVHQPGKHTSSLYHPFSNSTPSCKMSLFLGDSLHTADLVGNFSLIKFGQPRGCANVARKAAEGLWGVCGLSLAAAEAVRAGLEAWQAGLCGHSGWKGPLGSSGQPPPHPEQGPVV